MVGKMLGLTCVLIALFGAPFAEDVVPIAIDNDSETRMQELVIGVADLAHVKQAYIDVLKWKVKHVSPADLSIVNLWRL